MLLLGAPPEAVRAPPRAPLESKSISDGDDDGDGSAAAAASDDDDATDNPAGVTQRLSPPRSASPTSAPTWTENRRATSCTRSSRDETRSATRSRSTPTPRTFSPRARTPSASPRSAAGVSWSPRRAASRRDRRRPRGFHVQVLGAPTSSIHEDPVTGSGVCGLGPY